MALDILKLQIRQIELTEQIKSIKDNSIQIEGGGGYISITDVMQAELRWIERMIEQETKQ